MIERTTLWTRIYGRFYVCYVSWDTAPVLVIQSFPFFHSFFWDNVIVAYLWAVKRYRIYVIVRKYHLPEFRRLYSMYQNGNMAAARSQSDFFLYYLLFSSLDWLEVIPYVRVFYSRLQLSFILVLVWYIRVLCMTRGVSKLTFFHVFTS